MAAIFSLPKTGIGRSHRATSLIRRLILFTAGLGLPTSLGVASAQETGAGKEWTAPPAQIQKKNPIPANGFSLESGRQIYFKRCAACHGKTGNGDGDDAIDLGLHPAKFSDPRLREETDGSLYWKITVGKKPMPDYGRRLSPSDRWNLINYLRTLAK